jgi:hypothetical protein
MKKPIKFDMSKSPSYAPKLKAADELTSMAGGQFQLAAEKCKAQPWECLSSSKCEVEVLDHVRYGVLLLRRAEKLRSEHAMAFIEYIMRPKKKAKRGAK